MATTKDLPCIVVESAWGFTFALSNYDLCFALNSAPRGRFCWQYIRLIIRLADASITIHPSGIQPSIAQRVKHFALVLTNTPTHRRHLASKQQNVGLITNLFRSKWFSMGSHLRWGYRDTIYVFFGDQSLTTCLNRILSLFDGSASIRIRIWTKSRCPLLPLNDLNLISSC